VMMGAFSIDVADEQRAAWLELNRLRTTAGIPSDKLAEVERLFYAWPPTRDAKGVDIEFAPDNVKAIRDVWKDTDAAARCKVENTQSFRRNYLRIVELAESSR